VTQCQPKSVLFIVFSFFKGIKRIFKSASEFSCQRIQLFKHFCEGFSAL